MNSILSTISAVWSKFSEIFYLVYSYLDGLVTNLDAVTFEADSLIYQFLGAIRFVVGDEIYFVTMTMLTIGASFLLYKLFKKAFNLIISLIPGISGGAV